MTGAALAGRLVATGDDSAALIARVTLGAIILPHGLQKVAGWFGGYGFDGTMAFFTGTMGIPWPLALGAILAESLGAALLIAGALGRLAALAIAVNMAVAALTSHLDHGLFMNWFGAQAGEGFEFHLLAIGLALIVIVRGSGRTSVDRWLAAALHRGRSGATLA